MTRFIGFSVLSAVQMDKKLFTDKTSILSRWFKHFQFLFSTDRVIQDSEVLRPRYHHSKQNWMNYPLWKKLPSNKAVEERQRAGSTGFHERSGKMEDQHYSVSSTNSLSIVQSRANFQVISAMLSSLPLQKQERKVRLLQQSGDHSSLNRCKNACSCAPKQIGTYHCWWTSTRNSVWV